MKASVLIPGVILLSVWANFCFAQANHTIGAKDTIHSEKTKTFFDTLQYRASGKRITRELFDFIVLPHNPPKKLEKYMPLPEQFYSNYDGALIRNVTIRRIDVFGPEIFDTTLQVEKKVERIANSLHIKTHIRILKNYIIVKPGYYFDAREIADNERILRDLPSVHDARAVITHYDELNNTVDVEFLVKDVWSKGFGLETADFSDGKVELWNKNFLGTGHDFTNIFRWDNTRAKKTGYEGLYRTGNLFGSFINLRFHYISVFDLNEYSVRLARDFFAPGTKYAGSVFYRKFKGTEQIYFTPYQGLYYTEMENSRLWFARAFHIWQGHETWYRPNIVLSAGMDRYDFYQGPETSENLFYNYQSRALLYGGLSISGQRFYKTNYIYSFGRTEDIPEGYLVSGLIGYETSDYKDRYFLRFTLKGGKHINQLGYFFTSINTGNFVSKSYGPEQSAFHIKTNYFSDIIPLGRFRYRQLLQFRYVNGHNRYLDEFLTINKSDGIRAFSSDSIRSLEKTVFNLEGVLFSPLYFYGFRFVFYGFFDFAFIGKVISNPVTSNAYTGFGIGARIRNDRLVFKTIQIQLGFYPGAPPDMQEFMMNLRGEPRLRPENFYEKEPELFVFK